MYLQKRVEEAGEYLRKETIPYGATANPPIISVYSAYKYGTNKQKGTKGVPYYPCPAGFQCRELLVSELNISADSVTFDHCEKADELCMRILKRFLELSGIKDVDAYLLERRLPSE